MSCWLVVIHRSCSRKTMLTGTSKVTLDVPRDRALFEQDFEAAR